MKGFYIFNFRLFSGGFLDLVKYFINNLSPFLSTNAPRLKSTIENSKFHSNLKARGEIATTLYILIIIYPHFLVRNIPKRRKKTIVDHKTRRKNLKTELCFNGSLLKKLQIRIIEVE